MLYTENQSNYYNQQNKMLKVNEGERTRIIAFTNIYGGFLFRYFLFEKISTSQFSLI